jgi:Na+-transporting methylmalonyl-CoA/oxaloacetate decarboxylase gamma subunit
MGPETIDWGYAISTLLIRFVGIFVVLGILQVVMQIMGRIFAYLDAKKDLEKGLTQEEAAAVAMALYMYDRKT